MAEAFNRMTECPVCNLTYLHPRILPCFHSLCAQCVSRIKSGATIKCPMCNTTHDAEQVRSDFRMTQILDALKRHAFQMPQASDSMRCNWCREEPVAFLCMECNEWQCEACKTAHVNSKLGESHCLTAIAEKCQEVKDKVARQSSNIKRKVDAQSQNIARIDEEMKELEVIKTNALQESDELRKKSTNDVNKHFDLLNARVIDFIQAEVKRLEDTKNKLTQTLRDINSKRDTLERLVRESAAELAVNGAAVLQDITRLNETLITDDYYTEELEIKVVQDSQWNAATAARLLLNGGELRTDTDALSSRGLASNNVQYFKQKQVDLSNYSYALRLINQQLWSCQKDGRIEIYSLDLHLKRTLSNADWSTLHDVTEVTGGQLVVACYGGLFHVTHTGDTITKIVNESYNSAVWRHNKLYACANKPPTLRIFSYSNNTWHRLNTTPLHVFSNLATVTISVTNSAIFACNSRDDKIIKMSLTGEYVQTMGSEGSGAGQFDRPFLCQADDEDSLLVADRDNDRLQVRDSRGSWSIVRLMCYANSPSAVLFNGNKLYVVTSHKYLSLYKQADYDS